MNGYRFFAYGFIIMAFLAYYVNAEAADITQFSCEPAHIRLSTNRVAETATMCVEQNCVTAVLQEITQRYRPYPMLLVHYETEDDKHILFSRRPGLPLQVRLAEPTAGGATITKATCEVAQQVSS